MIQWKLDHHTKTYVITQIIHIGEQPALQEHFACVNNYWIAVNITSKVVHNYKTDSRYEIQYDETK